ncbi:glucose-6-phosphate dehydrogenase [Xylanibacillus composti]|uniref:Glucose-6-phosphate 1-dehydrogenase n=1 Tax=Xylanibacillus composti TaxID=1572762 RepID=A0A8J4M1S9_9BACL|nr:glucose-6-phosphate dehydrogenase [Xylanibacillus composti]MDT9723572.1 glucose-6-phosphate dehydrogenase [Xylanibacillus composti]GIQ68390.1 glucose-6-phosphate 1-dehydrogenase [Xylanibacillus composti]
MEQNQTKPLEGTLLFIFGATGDLAKRKLYPAIYSLYREGKLSDKFAVIGLARRPKTNDQFREDVKQSIAEFSRYPNDEDSDWPAFAAHFEYMSLNTNDVEGFRELEKTAVGLEAEFGLSGNRLFYLALAPELFGQVAHHLRDGGLLAGNGWKRVVIEKPFGYDLKSALALNEEIRNVFEEKDIYRIDHYLGKEMIQNIEVIRFANAFFEPLWNRHHIANIQITSSETVGVEDRGGYYDNSGALRDMVQNHMLQMIAMMAMEPPSRNVSEDIRDEKAKVLRSLRLYGSHEEVAQHVIRGQYGSGAVKGKNVPAYRDEESVNPASTTETFVAAKVMVDNNRWAGVPFYIRTGKRMPVKSTEIVVEFKGVPSATHKAQQHALEPNLLVFRVNPMEGIYIKINAKKPGTDGVLVPVAMDFCQSCQVGWNTPEAYERLLHDAIRGDSTYFTRWDEVSHAWAFTDRIAEAWSHDEQPLHTYEAGSWGPDAAHGLLARDGFKWWPVNGQDESDVVWVTNRSE